MAELQSKLKGITNLLYFIAFISYEIFYCNAMNLVNFIEYGDIKYNFSPFRIICYGIFNFLIFKFFSKFKKIGENNIKTKCKANILLFMIIMNVLLFIGFIFIIDNYSLIKLYSISIMLFSMITIIYIYISNDIIKNIIIVSITLGYIFSILTDYNSALDEKKHFMTAYNISQFNFNYLDEPITDKKIEAIGQIAEVQNANEIVYENYEKQHSLLNENDIPSTPTTYNVILYIPSAIGIMTAEHLGGSLNDMYVAGRMMNLLIYTFLICAAIKILPYKKNIFFILSYMPMALLLASSYSIDNFCVGITFLFISYCLNLYSKNRALNKKEIIRVLLLFFAMLIPKDMAYIFVALIIFTLPIIKTIKENKKFIIKLSIILLLISILLGLLFFYIINNNVISDPRGATGIDKYAQISYILTSPLEIIILITRHLLKETLLNFNWLNGLNHTVYFGPFSSMMFLLYFIFVIYVTITENDKLFKLKDRVLMITTFLITYIPISLILYISFTPVGLEIIHGVQPRYIIPILPLLLFTINSKTIKLVKNQNRNKIIAITLITLIITNILLVILY